MSFLRKLFGGGSSGEPKAATVTERVEYKGFTIEAAPMPEGGQYRLAANVSKEINGARKTHRLIRADVFQAQDQASEFSVRKAKQMIDEQGDRLFA